MTNAEAVLKAEAVFNAAVRESLGETPERAASLLYDAAEAVAKLLVDFVVRAEDLDDLVEDLDDDLVDYGDEPAGIDD